MATAISTARPRSPVWADGPAKPSLPGRGEVHIWRLPLPEGDGELAACESLLSEDEALRRGRYRSCADRRRFAAGRGALRTLLGAYLEVPPREVAFSVEEGGRPVLADPARRGRVRFNVSHSGGLVLLAFAAGMDVGVDVERLARDVDCIPMARHFFPAGEHAALEALPPAERRRAFLTAWTCREAGLKAIGSGLAVPLGAVDLELSRGRSLARIRMAGGGRPRTLSLIRFEPMEGYVGAVAAGGADGKRPRALFWRMPGS